MIYTILTISDLANEIWMQTLNGKYLISNLGRLKSITCNKATRYEPRILKQHINNCGYLMYNTRGSSGQLQGYVHRLVAEAFIINESKKPCVNHKNGVKTDNRVENLEWVTYLENHNHSVNIGIQNNNGELNGKSKLTSGIVKEILDSDISYPKLGKKYNVSQSVISDIKNGYTWNSVTGFPKKVRPNRRVASYWLK